MRDEQGELTELTISDIYCSKLNTFVIKVDSLDSVTFFFPTSIQTFLDFSSWGFNKKNKLINKINITDWIQKPRDCCRLQWLKQNCSFTLFGFELEPRCMLPDKPIFWLFFQNCCLCALMPQRNDVNSYVSLHNYSTDTYAYCFDCTTSAPPLSSNVIWNFIWTVYCHCRLKLAEQRWSSASEFLSTWASFSSVWVQQIVFVDLWLLSSANESVWVSLEQFLAPDGGDSFVVLLQLTIPSNTGCCWKMLI